MTNREDRTEILNGAGMALIACIACVAFVVLFGAGCASKAPAAPQEFKVPEKCCANPNCPCDDCQGDCICGAKTDANLGAQYLDLEKRFRDEVARVDKLAADVARSRTAVDEAEIDHEQKSKFEAEVNYAPYQVNGVWHCERNGKTFAYKAVRCYGPDVPCDFDWVEVKSVLKQGGAAPSVSASGNGARRTTGGCASGNCGQVQRFQPRGRTRWFK